MSSLKERVTAAYEREVAAAAEPMTAADLPLNYEAITDRWLTAVVCEKAPGAAVLSHTLSPPDKGTTNRRKIYLQYNAAGNDAGLPPSVFCKATHELRSRIILGSFGAVQSEITFYNRIRPRVQIEAPVALFAHYDPESFNSIIMLADLTDDVQEFCDHRTQVDRPRAESQARLLARLHGASHTDPELIEQARSFDTFTNNFRKLLATGYEEGSTAGFMSSEEFIPPSVYRRHAEIWPATVASIEALETAPTTLTHGDVHLKNWYVAGNGEMGLGDWQCISRANPVRDLAYALSTALTTENRRAWERDLLKYYLEELASAGGPRIGLDSAWQMYRQQMISALLFWTITIWVTPLRPQVQPRDTSIEFVRRISSAMEDLESLDVRVGR